MIFCFCNISPSVLCPMVVCSLQSFLFAPVLLLLLNWISNMPHFQSGKVLECHPCMKHSTHFEHNWSERKSILNLNMEFLREFQCASRVLTVRDRLNHLRPTRLFNQTNPLLFLTGSTERICSSEWVSFLSLISCTNIPQAIPRAVYLLQSLKDHNCRINYECCRFSCAQPQYLSPADEN